MPDAAWKRWRKRWAAAVCTIGTDARRRLNEARSFVISSVRRRLGLTMARELARHRLNRVPLINVPGDELRPMTRFMRGEWRRRYGSPSDPPEHEPTIINEEYYAFQAHAPALA